MTVTYDQPYWHDANVALIRWSSTETDPTYRVYVNGELVAEGSVTEWLLWAGDQLEVLDDANAVAAGYYPGRVRLYWWGSGNQEYRVEQQIASVWTQRARLTDDDRGYWSWESDILDDVTTHYFRVVAVGTSGEETVCNTLTVYMCRRPDVPDDVTWSYSDSTRQLTIAAT